MAETKTTPSRRRVTVAPDVQTSYLDCMTSRQNPGVVRDAIIAFLREQDEPQTVSAICQGVNAALATDVPKSSVRSYLGANVPQVFDRVRHGTYRLARR